MRGPLSSCNLILLFVIYMRVFSCKSHCPFICSSKSFLHLYSPCPLRLEDVQHAPDTKPKSKYEKPELEDEKTVIVKEVSDDGQVEIVLKSSLKKSPDAGTVEVPKERVKWMDHVGKELVEIREFEPIDLVDSEDNGDGNPACICVVQ